MPAGMTLSLKAVGEPPFLPLAGECVGRFLVEAVSRSGLWEEDLRKGPYPFSVSFPMPLEAGRRALRVGEGRRFRLRVSWLADADLPGLLDWVGSLACNPTRLQTVGGELVVEGALVSNTLVQRWNRWVPYGQLYDEASDSVRHVTLKFYSPTALMRSGLTYPLPDPSGIFTGYQRVWETFSGIPLAPGLREVMDRELCLVDFRLRRRLFAGAHGPVPGFAGSASFELGGRHPESILKGLNALADYAFFCGTGTGTEKGMGLTRRITDRAGRT